MLYIQRIKGVRQEEGTTTTDNTNTTGRFTDHCRLTGPWWSSMKNLIYDGQLYNDNDNDDDGDHIDT